MSKRTKTLSDQLRAAIDASGKTRYRIAMDTEIDESALAKFYHGTRSFPIHKLERLATALGYEITLRKSDISRQSHEGK